MNKRKIGVPASEWESLADKIKRWANVPIQTAAAVPELMIHKYEAPTEMAAYVLEPSVCMIAQGVKRVVLGKDVFAYEARHFVITAVDLPVMAQIVKAGKENPYLALTLKLDLRLIAQLMAECKLSPPRQDPANRGIVISKVSPPLLNGFHRLMDLLDAPDDIPILAPLIHREIHYRLLSGDQGSRLMQIAAAGSRSNQVSQVIDWLKGNLDKRIHVENLAAQIGMSSSALYQHFQAITAISPLQFQKRLRLTEARKLMLTEHLDAATVAYKVGYESPSQFSREYRRHFGAPPSKDVKEVQQAMSNGSTRKTRFS